MIIEQPFPSSFKFEVLSELRAANPRRWFYPGANESGGQDGVNIQMVPSEGQEWIGTFAMGRFGSKSITGVFTAPNADRLCVVAQGQAFIVDANNPNDCESLPIVPVIDVRSSKEHQLLIFASYTELLAVGVNGIAWRTERLSWDGLKLTHVTKEAIHGVFWDIQTESEQGFTVDLVTGAHSGGVSFPEASTI